MASSKDANGPLRRLGGGRWASRDGRFTIEPQGGTWVLVDSEQLDELGLPRIRGPFASLGDARDAIATLHDQPAESSPLASRLEGAEAAGGGGGPAAPGAAERPGRKCRGSKAAEVRAHERPSRPPAEPPVPSWIAALPLERRKTALALIADLTRAGLAAPERLARSEIEDDRAAVAAALLARRLRGIAEAGDESTRGALRRAIAVLGEGGDPAALRLPGWRLVDDRGRSIELDPDDID